MRKWIAVLLLSILLLEALPVTALATAVSGKPITEDELAAARALAGLNDGAGAFHNGVPVSAAMNARQLSNWLDEQLEGTLLSVGSTLSRVHAALADLQQKDPEEWQALTQEGDGPALVARCAAIQLEAENLRQDLRFMRDGLDENIAMVRQMSSLLDSRMTYDYEVVRFSERVRRASDSINAIRQDILDNSVHWQTAAEDWQSIVNGNYRGNSAVDAELGAWISRVFDAETEEVSAETKVTIGAPLGAPSTRASRLRANEGVLANPSVGDVKVKVLGKDQIGFQFYKSEEGKKNVGIENVVVRVRDANDSNQKLVEATTDGAGRAAVQINSFTVDEDDYVTLYMEVDASKTGYRDLCKPMVQMQKGSVHNVYLVKDDHTPYVYRGTFNGYDFLYDQFNFLHSEENFDNFDIVLETRNAQEIPVMCTEDDVKNVQMFKPTAIEGNVFTFRDQWKHKLDPEKVKELYFQWGEKHSEDKKIDVLLMPVDSVFDEPTDLSGTFDALDAGFGFSIEIPGIKRRLDVGCSLIDFPIKASVDPMGNAVVTIGKSSEKLGKLDPNWKNKEMDYWRKLTKGVEKDISHYRENRSDLKDELESMRFPVMKAFDATFGVFAIFSVAWQEDDKGKRYSGEASVGGSVAFSFDAIEYGTIGPFPVYTDFNLTVSASLAFGLSKVNVEVDKKLTKDGDPKILSTQFVPIPDVSFQITVAISLTLGAGIKGLVSLWAKGSASITFLGAWTVEGFDFKINAAADVSGGLTVFVIEASMVIFGGEWQLYPENNSYSLLDRYMPRRNDGGDAVQAGGSDEPETYPQLAPTLSAELSGLDNAQGDFRILTLSDNIYAFLIQDGRIHWKNLTKNTEGSIADVLAECQSRYDNGIDVAGMKDYAFDVCIASGIEEDLPGAKGSYPPCNDYFAVAGLCAAEFVDDKNKDDYGFPEAGQGTCLYTLFLWPDDDGDLVFGLNGKSKQLSYFRSAWMGGETSPVTDYQGAEPRILLAKFHAIPRMCVISHEWKIERTYQHSVIVEVKSLERSDTNEAQRICALQESAEFKCIDKPDVASKTLNPDGDISIISLNNSVQGDDVVSGAGADYARVFSRYIADNTWIAVSRSEGGAGDDGAIELYDDPSMSGSKKSVPLATGDINRFTVLPGASADDPTTLFYVENINTEERARHYMLKSLWIDPAQRGDDGSMTFSTVVTAYDVNLPTDKIKVRRGDIDLIYWLSNGPKSADGKDLYRIHFATYDPATNTLADDSVFAEFSLPDSNMAVRELYLTDNGTWYFTAGGVPATDQESYAPKPLSLYSFPTQMAPVLDMKNQVIADLLVCPGEFDDFTVSVMNSGNLAATAFDVDLVLLDGSKDGVPLERLHTDLQNPENNSLSTLDGGGQTTAIVIGEKAFFRLEDYEFTARQRDFVISEQKTNYVIEDGGLKSKDSEDAKSDYVKSNLMMPGAKAVFKGAIKIPDNWNNEKQSEKDIELRLSSFSSNFNWVSAMGAASGRRANAAVNALGDLTWTRDPATGDMVPTPRSVQGERETLLAKTVGAPESKAVKSFHDLAVHHRIYRGPNNEKMLHITVTDLANTGERIKLTGALYLDDSEDPIPFGMDHFPGAVSNAATHNFDMPLAALVDPSACQKARVVIKGVGIEDCAMINNEFTLYLNGMSDPLTIVRQPRDVTIQEGESASFDVEAAGGVKPYSYQWQIWDAKHEKWVDIPGATDPVLSRENVEKKWDGARFRCVITDSAGNTVTSEAATLTVRDGVDTGDHSNLPLYLAVAAIALALLWWVRRRSRRA